MARGCASSNPSRTHSWGSKIVAPASLFSLQSGYPVGLCLFGTFLFRSVEAPHCLTGLLLHHPRYGSSPTAAWRSSQQGYEGENVHVTVIPVTRPKCHRRYDEDPSVTVVTTVTLILGSTHAVQALTLTLRTNLTRSKPLHLPSNTQLSTHRPPNQWAYLHCCLDQIFVLVT